MDSIKSHKIIIALIISILLIFVIYSFQSHTIIYHLVKSDVTSVIQDLSSYGFLAAFVFMLLITIEVIFAPIPPLILYLVAGAMFGGLLGGIYALIGNALGASIDFWIARTFGRNYIEKKVPHKLRRKFDHFFSKYGTVSIFLLRLNPLTTSDFFSYMAGFSKMKYLGFIAATVLGLIPYIFIQSYLGDIFTRNNIIFNTFLLLSFVYIIIFVILIILIKTSDKKNKS
ncbi:TVP38/TMEM64 family protein [Patescibacteria group bacterium]|nr:TVP38/TMEM64 family protein [Patescibacteria group bacterium]